MSRSGSTTRDRTRVRRRPAERGRAPRPARRPNRRSARQRRLLAGAVVLTVVAAVAWLLWLAPFLAVRSVQVDGVATLSADQVREAAQVADGRPLLRVDLGAVEERVARLPQVRDVQAARGWPDRIVVTVAERVPVAVVGGPGDRSLVDVDGILFDTVTGEPPRGVVPLEVADPGPEDAETRAGLAAIRALPPGLREDVEQVAVPDADDVEFTMADGTVVRWGGPEDSDTKGTVVVDLLERIAAGDLEPAAVLDVSAPDAVLLR